MSDCAVVIVNYNAGGHLTDAVRSAVAAGASEIVVVDNGSSDDSLALLEASSSGWPLRIVRNGKNVGFAAGCNVGVRASSAGAILFLNPDCRLEDGALAALLGVLHSDPRIGMVGPLLLNPDGSEQRGGRNLLPTPVSGFARAFGLTWLGGAFRDFNLNGTPLPTAPIEVESVSGGCMLVKRAAIAAVGLWDEGYFLYCEDLDLCMRFGRAGWRIVFVPQARATHVRRVSARRRPVFVEWHKHRGMVRYYEKFYRDRYPRLLLWLVESGVWLRFGILAAVYRVRGWLRPGAAA